MLPVGGAGGSCADALSAFPAQAGAQQLRCSEPSAPRQRPEGPGAHGRSLRAELQLSAAPKNMPEPPTENPVVWI